MREKGPLFLIILSNINIKCGDNDFNLAIQIIMLWSNAYFEIAKGIQDIVGRSYTVCQGQIPNIGGSGDHGTVDIVRASRGIKPYDS